MAAMEICPVVLLTGAGFTRNFGGYLAREMLTEIRNESSIFLRNWIDSHPLDNFEALYDKSLADSDPTAAKDMSAALMSAFRRMDERINDLIQRGRYAQGVRNTSSVFGQFISQFAGETHRSRAFWFTLNQDLLVERAWNPGQQQINLRIPGLQNTHWFSGSCQYDIASDELRRTLPANPVPHFEPDGRQEPFNASTSFVYIKLHGSINWRSHDSRDCLVIGTRKSEQIKGEPLLNQYFEVFEKLLCRAECKLLVIGYGFRDPHINEVICNAISSFGLQVFVVNRMEYDKLKTCLQAAPLPDGTNAADKILQGVKHVEPQAITEFYDDQYGITETGRTLLKKLKIRNW